MSGNIVRLVGSSTQSIPKGSSLRIQSMASVISHSDWHPPQWENPRHTPHAQSEAPNVVGFIGAHFELDSAETFGDCLTTQSC